MAPPTVPRLRGCDPFDSSVTIWEHISQISNHPSIGGVAYSVEKSHSGLS